MNIFEYLGLPANHRVEKKVTQLVKHFDEVPESSKKGKVLAGQVKKDGVCALTVVRVDGNIKIFSRTGKEFTNTHIVISNIRDLGLSSGVYMGEMWTPKSIASLEQVSGATNPNRVNPLSAEAIHIPGNLDMAFFDMISVNEFIAGSCATRYIDRHQMLIRSYHAEGPYYVKRVGSEVLPWHMVNGDDAINELLEEQIKKGEEGIVIRDLEANWVAGHKGWRVMKKVRGVDYDLKCIGYEEGTGKYKGKVANLLFNWKGGKTVKAMLGKGWTHDMARNMFLDIQANTGTFGKNLSPIGGIFQVYALEESSKGLLRLVKVGERRHDKDESDV
jgi:ATP-dependent DNA ligase